MDESTEPIAKWIANAWHDGVARQGRLSLYEDRIEFVRLGDARNTEAPVRIMLVDVETIDLTDRQLLPPGPDVRPRVRFTTRDGAVAYTVGRPKRVLAQILEHVEQRDSRASSVPTADASESTSGTDLRPAGQAPGVVERWLSPYSGPLRLTGPISMLIAVVTLAIGVVGSSPAFVVIGASTLAVGAASWVARVRRPGPS